MTYAEIDTLRLQMRNEMQEHLPKWRLLSRFIAPKRLKEDGSPRIDGARKTKDIIRNTAGRSLRTFVSGMMDGATPRDRSWFNQVSSDPRKMQIPKVKSFLKQSEMIIQSHLQVSNFYRALMLAYKDVGIFSNAAFAQLPHPRFGFYFYPYTIGTYAFSCDLMGNTNMFTRTTTITVREVVQNFAKLNDAGQIQWDTIPKAIKSLYETRRFLDEVEIAQVIVPNPNYNPVFAKKSINPLDMKFQSYTYVLSIGGPMAGVNYQGQSGFRQQQRTSGSVSEKDPQYLKISGYNYFPVITPRWEVEPEGNYGVDGPGEMAIDDIMTLQEQEKLRMEGSYKLVRPPMVGHAALRRYQSSILAGGITYLDDRSMEMGFKPAFQVGPALADLVANQAEVEFAIQSAFFEDVFKMISRNETKSHVSVAEINERSAEKMAVLAPILGQWDFDLSSKVINNSMDILTEQGRMPERPAELEGADIRPEYTSILAQAAKSSQVNTRERYANFVSSYAQAMGDPSLASLANHEKFLRGYADDIGVNPDELATPEEFKELREGIQQRQAEERQIALAQQRAESAQKMSQTPLNNGSLLDTIAS